MYKSSQDHDAVCTTQRKASLLESETGYDAVALIAAIPLARLPLEQLEGSLTRKQNETGYQGIVECMEDIAASLVATVTAAPQISRYLISGTDQPVLLTLRHWHDILIPKLAMEDQSVDRTALEAIAGSCCWLALQILQHGVIRHHCSESVALSYGIPTPSISDELLPLLMNMKSVRVSSLKCSDNSMVQGCSAIFWKALGHVVRCDAMGMICRVQRAQHRKFYWKSSRSMVCCN